MTLSEELASWASTLALEDVPNRVRATARSLVLSQLAAARATLRHDLGQKVLRGFGSPLQEDPKAAAYSLAALTIALDFDDTVFAGHVTHSAVNVSLAYARSLQLGGAAMLAATLASIECAARVTAAATLGPARGQTAAYTHLVGAVAARMHIERAPQDLWVSALGIALTAPPRPLLRGFIGSDAKLLTAATPLRAGLDACDAAKAGLRGAADILEHPDGFLAACADVPLPELCITGLGERWHTETAAFKVHPGSAYIASCADCAIELHGRLGGVDPDDVAAVTVEASIFTAELEQRTGQYLDGPRSSAVALAFSVGYGVATALLTGSLTPADLSHERVREERRWRLVEKVSVEHDAGFTIRALASTAPVGEALRRAGDRAGPWLEAQGGAAQGGVVQGGAVQGGAVQGGATQGDAVQGGAVQGGAAASALITGLGPPAESFELTDKALGARVTVTFADGREVSASREFARGATGPQTRAHHFDLMREKFLATGGDCDVVDGVERLESLDSRELSWLLSAALCG